MVRTKVTISERRACELVGISQTVLHYDSKVALGNEQLKARIVQLATERRRFGYRRIHALVAREGIRANHKRIYRLYTQANLAVRRRKKRRGLEVDREALVLPRRPNETGRWTSSWIPLQLAAV
jgi:putative transposase